MNELHPGWLIAAALALALIPLVLGVLTAYMKLSIVLGLLRNALGTQQAPGALIVSSLSIALTLVISAPVVEESRNALGSIDIGKIAAQPSVEALNAFEPVIAPWRAFLFKHSGERELAALRTLRRKKGEDFAGNMPQAPLSLLIPAFMLTELKEAFAMGFALLLPFLAIDLIVANMLAGLGMYMVSPMLISLPLKIFLFVVADGWLLLAKGLVESYA